MESKPRTVDTYTFNGEEISFPLGTHGKKDIQIDIQKNKIKAGFKGEPPIINGKLIYEIRPDESIWTMTDSTVNIELDFKNKGMMPPSILIVPNDFTTRQEGERGDVSSMDPHSLYHWGHVLAHESPDLSFETLKMAADMGHHDAICDVSNIYLGKGEEFGHVYAMYLDNIQARKYLSLGADLYPSPNFYYVLGNLSKLEDDLPQAIDWYQKGIDLKDDSCACALSDMYFQSGEYEKATQLIAPFSSTSAIAAMTLSVQLFKLGHYDAAISCYESANLLNPKVGAQGITLDDMKKKRDELKRSEETPATQESPENNAQSSHEHTKTQKNTQKTTPKSGNITNSNPTTRNTNEPTETSSLVLWLKAGLLVGTLVGIGAGTYFLYKHLRDDKNQQ